MDRNNKGQFIKGIPCSEEKKLYFSKLYKGKPLSEEHKKKISESRIKGGIKPICGYKKGCVSPSKGKKYTEEHKKKIGDAQRGAKARNWKGGLVPLKLMIRKTIEYRNWRFKVFTRDNFKCQDCGKNKELEAHHLISYSKIVSDFLSKYNQFSPIDDKETLLRLSYTHEDFWNIDNGKTLCLECHKLTDTYCKDIK